ncbi:hypothetical protein M9435_003700 [Picochlorum sp. BPE23]|nr:hypothetical protein M9435_003700 [Picochlorum sp. BPE23]
MAPSATVKREITAAQGFLAKSDGKDKLLATLQYAAMFLSAGSPGAAKKVQVSLATARKAFRIMKPVESILPVVMNPSLDWRRPVYVEILKKLKCILMAVYFGGDHIVWLKLSGLIATDPKKQSRFIELAQKASLYGWFGGSLCGILTEIYDIQNLLSKKYGETDEAYVKRQKELEPELRRRAIVLVHGVFQALLAVGLLGLRPWKPRTVGLFGVAASAINCYMLYPAVDRSSSVTATTGAGAAAGGKKKDDKKAA